MLSPPSELFKTPLCGSPTEGQKESLFTPEVLGKVSLPAYFRGFAKGWFPKGWFWRMFPRHQTAERGYIRMFPRYPKPERGYIQMLPGIKTGTRHIRQNHPFRNRPSVPPRYFKSSQLMSRLRRQLLSKVGAPSALQTKNSVTPLL